MIDIEVRVDLERLERILEKHEGLRLHPYKCSEGKLTIGIGRNLEDVGISETEAYFLLGNDIRKAADGLKRVLGEYTFEDLSEVRKESLVNMIFNLGIDGFRGFRNMIDAIRKGNHYKASREMLKSEWAEQVGKRAEDISNAYRNNEWGI